MAKKYQYAVVIGRFQPFHNLHKKLVDYALETADKVIVVLGSHKAASDIRNPFSSEQRQGIIQSCFNLPERERLSFHPVRDYWYDDNTWVSEIQNIVRTHQEEFLDASGEQFDEVLHNSKLLDVKVALVGYFKDESSYYLKLFPQWSFVEIPTNSRESQVINATDIRNAWFEGDKYDDLVPQGTATYLKTFRATQPFNELKGEFSFTKKYIADTQFVNAPYKPSFTTTDAVVTAMHHVLLVRRGFNPGKGLLALPGGFLQPELRLLDNAIKELKEETKIRVDADELRKHLKNERVFDHPFRSLRGRTVTYAYHFSLTPNLKAGLPIVKGGDDADKAFWLPISDLSDYEDKFFEDHYSIISYFLRAERS